MKPGKGTRNAVAGGESLPSVIPPWDEERTEGTRICCNGRLQTQRLSLLHLNVQIHHLSGAQW